VTGDWNADGTTTIGLFNMTASKFFLRETNSNGAPDNTFVYNTGIDPNGVAVVGDWDGL